METALAIVNLFNAAAPGAATLIMMIKKKDGTISVVAMLDEADAKFDENIAQARAWLESHPAPEPATPTGQ